MNYSRFFFIISLFVFFNFTSCDFKSYEPNCLPDTAQCVEDETKIKICSEDGSQWITQSCGANFICKNDECIALTGGELQIQTEELPEAQNDENYSVSLEVIGGYPPYAWQVLEGKLPDGFHLDSDGILWGITSDVGTFSFTLRVLDGSTPPLYESLPYDFVVNISPLTIVGDNEYSLGPAKIIILPVLIPYASYDTQLQGKGGMRPYLWEQTEPPSIYNMYISNWGLPSDLALTEDGRIIGTVSDTSDAETVTLPNGTTITGYFLYIRLSDSQEPSKSTASVFFIPTVPM